MPTSAKPRLEKRTPGVAHVLAHLGEIFDREAQRDVGEEPRESEGAVLPGQPVHRVLAGLEHLVAIRHLEFVGKGVAQSPVNALCDGHWVTAARLT